MNVFSIPKHFLNYLLPKFFIAQDNVCDVQTCQWSSLTRLVLDDYCLCVCVCVCVCACWPSNFQLKLFEKEMFLPLPHRNATSQATRILFTNFLINQNDTFKKRLQLLVNLVVCSLFIFKSLHYGTYPLIQWLPTGVPRNTRVRVPQRSIRGAAKFEITVFIDVLLPRVPKIVIFNLEGVPPVF